MYFRPVKIDYSELVTGTEWNRLLLERLTDEDKKTIGMLIFLTTFRICQEDNWVERHLLAELDTLLAGKKKFEKYLVGLAEEYFSTLFAGHKEPINYFFRKPQFLGCLETVYHLFEDKGVVNLNLPPF
jgi:hypothetical protein